MKELRSTSAKLVLGGLTLLGTLAALPRNTSQAQEYGPQPYYQYEYQQPPPPPPVVYVPPVVTYQRPYDPRALYWARRHWLRHHDYHHHHHDHDRGHDRGRERHGRGHRR